MGSICASPKEDIRTEDRSDFTGIGAVDPTGEKAIGSAGRGGADGYDYEIQLDKSGGTMLGIDCYSEDSQTLVVGPISGGLVDEWNRANPSKPVKVGDRIVEVNGIRGNDTRLLEQMREKKMMTIKLLSAGNDLQFIVLDLKFARADADKNSDLVGEEIPLGTVITALETKMMPGQGVERVCFEYNGTRGWLSVQEADGSEVLSFVEEANGVRRFEVLEQKYARAEADKNSDLVGDEIPEGTVVTSIESTIIASPDIKRVRFCRGGVMGWLSVVEADGSEVLGDIKDQDIQEGLNS